MTTKPVPAGCGNNNRWPERRVTPPQAAEASSELLDDEQAERRMTVARRFWTAYVAVLLVAVCAGIAHFLPALPLK